MSFVCSAWAVHVCVSLRTESYTVVCVCCVGKGGVISPSLMKKVLKPIGVGSGGGVRRYPDTETVEIEKTTVGDLCIVTYIYVYNGDSFDTNGVAISVYKWHQSLCYLLSGRRWCIVLHSLATKSRYGTNKNKNKNLCNSFTPQMLFCFQYKQSDYYQHSNCSTRLIAFIQNAIKTILTDRTTNHNKNL